MNAEERALCYMVATAYAIAIVRGQQQGMPRHLIEYAAACTGISVIWMITEKLR